ncbi:MAG: hypothetical protein ABFD54_16535 [Armatimonadota bacterium]|nr:hypothetical protein [bacterium]
MMMFYSRGDEIEVVIDREGLGVDEGVGHLADETMVVIVGAGGRIGQAVQATVMAIQKTRLGPSLIANARL